MGLADFERSSHFPDHSQFHLERVRLLVERLDCVDKAVPTVHVAGTKGKGSTCALITSILTEAGYRVGLYTSPHLHSVCERVRVGLEPVSKDDYAALIAKIWPAVESVGEDGGYGGVTFFEMMTALALVHFRDIEADIQVMEVGLGGRLDATNILTPVVSVITSISLDHVATLGNTIARIAAEKAGIVKAGVPCVVAPQAETDAIEVFERTTMDRGSRLVSASELYSWEAGASDLAGQELVLQGPNSEYRLRTPLLGDYQLENIATAVASVEVLADHGYSIQEAAIERGVRRVSWPGRFQTFDRDGRTLVVDGAHNPYSVGRLIDNVIRLLDPEGVVLVFGALGGHSAEGMLRVLESLQPRTVAVQSRHPRSSRTGLVAATARDLGLKVVAEEETVAEGLALSLDIADDGDLILCTGSLAVVAEILESLEGIEPEIYENLAGPVNRPVSTG